MKDTESNISLSRLEAMPIEILHLIFQHLITQATEFLPVCLVSKKLCAALYSSYTWQVWEDNLNTIKSIINESIDLNRVKLLVSSNRESKDVFAKLTPDLEKRIKIVEKAQKSESFALASIGYSASARLLLEDRDSIKAIGNAHSKVVSQQFFDRALYIAITERDYELASFLKDELGAKPDQIQVDKWLYEAVGAKDFRTAIAIQSDFGAQPNLVQIKKLLLNDPHRLDWLGYNTLIKWKKALSHLENPQKSSMSF